MANNFRVDVRSDMRKKLASFQLSVNGEVQASATRAINRTLTTVRATAARALGAEYPGLKSKVIKGRMKMIRATRAAPTGTLIFSGKRFSLFYHFPRLRRFRTKYGTGISIPGALPFGLQTAAGAPISRDDISHAFLQRSRRGYSAVWQRIGSRYPITPILAEGLSRAFIERHIDLALTQIARQRFAIVFSQELNFRAGLANG